MRIGGLTGWESSVPARNAGSGASISAPSDGQAARKADIENARSTALSALRNDRFRSMLTQIGTSKLGDVLMRMPSTENGAQAGLPTVRARYAENSE